MAQPRSSDPPITLILVHRVITRGLEVGLRYTEEYARDGYPDRVTGAGFGLYLRTLAGDLFRHHSAEDEIAFPFLRDKMPDLPFDALIAEHEEMEAMLKELAPIFDRLKGEEGEAPSLEAAHDVLTRLSAVWPGHIDVEESSISMRALSAQVSEEELGRWLQSMGQHSPEGSPPEPLALPFLLFNLSPEDRAIMAHQLPPVVIQELVPGPWQEHWAPMKPFLLD